MKFGKYRIIHEGTCSQVIRTTIAETPDESAKNRLQSKIFIRRMRHDSSLKRAAADGRNIYEVGCVTCVDFGYMKN